MKLSIIIPFYNEQDTVVEVLKRLDAVQWPDFLLDREYICVDDASKDEGFHRVETFIKDKSHIRLFQLEKNSGKGAAVKHGISEAKGDVFFIQDADLELSPDDIPLMLRTMRDLNVEFVNGSRYLPGPIRPLSSYRRYWINRFFTFLTSMLINVKLTDMACGYKLIKRDLYEKIRLKENRFGFEAELILKAIRIKKNNVAEVPVQYFPRNLGQGKKIRNIDGFRILKTIFLYGALRLK